MLTVIYCRACGMPLRGVVNEDHSVEWHETCDGYDLAEEQGQTDVLDAYDEQLRQQAEADKIDAAMEKSKEEGDYFHFAPDI